MDMFLNKFSRLGVVGCIFLCFPVADGTQLCRKQTEYLSCEYGCCGELPNQYCCGISTSMLVAACVVGGLIVVTVVATAVVCGYKYYRDRRATRVQRLQIQSSEPRNNVSPPKPPAYIDAPPEYSKTMPDTHYRPLTVTGYVSMNQRFRSNNDRASRHSQQTDEATLVPGTVSISFTNSSGQYPADENTRACDWATSGRRQLRVTGDPTDPTAIPEDPDAEAPPPYREVDHGHMPAQSRHRRFITTPEPETQVSELNPSIVERNLQAHTTNRTRAATQHDRVQRSNIGPETRLPLTRVEERSNGPRSTTTVTNAHDSTVSGRLGLMRTPSSIGTDSPQENTQSAGTFTNGFILTDL